MRMAALTLPLFLFSVTSVAGAEEPPAPAPAGEILWTFDTGG
jgi:hypothetical protein